MCVDTSQDAAHCGSCGHACDRGVSCQAGACQACVGTPEIPVGTTPRSVAVVDLDRDGKPDLVTANAGDSTVSVLLGRGDGTFDNRTDLPTGHSPYAVVAADFNRDGIVDLATADRDDDSVGVLLGEGAAAFGTLSRFDTDPSPTSLVAADLDGDGTADLATINRAGNVSVLLARGDGTFLPPVDHAVGTLIADIVAADLNSDGLLDLAVTREVKEGAGVLLGLGQGDFAPVRFSPYLMLNRIAPGDWDRDGILDLAFSVGDGRGWSAAVGVMHGQGDGTFTKLPYLRSWHCSQVALADVDGDGFPDLVALCSDSSLAILLNRQPENQAAWLDVSILSDASSFVVADVDNDGRLDVVTAHTSPNAVVVHLGNGDGTFRSPCTP